MLNEEVRRRERVIRIFPTRASIIRLLGALLMEEALLQRLSDVTQRAATRLNCSVFNLEKRYGIYQQ